MHERCLLLRDTRANIVGMDPGLPDQVVVTLNARDRLSLSSGGCRETVDDAAAFSRQ